MQPNISYEPRPKHHIVLKIIVSIIALLVIAGIVVLAFAGIRQTHLEAAVKTELIKQNKILKASEKEEAYPSTLPSGIAATDAVAIEAVVGGSGTTYCIVGTSKASEKIVYHMDKETPEDKPARGSCSGGATEPPEPPTGVSILSVGAGVVSLQWSAAPFAAKYTIGCATDEAFTKDLKTVSASGTAATVEGLSSNLAYYCRVAASNSLGQSGWSTTVSSQTEAYSAAPKDLKTLSVSGSQLMVTWLPVSGALSYNLQYSPDISFSKDVVTVNIASPSFSAVGLKSGTNYFFHVQAVTSGFDAQTAAFSDIVLGRTNN